MDEPTTALDVVVQREILQQIDALKRDFGFAVLFITHDLSLLLEFADRIAIMYAGEIVETAPAATLGDEPAAPVHAGAARVVPAADRPADAADRDPRLAARPPRPAARLPLPSALPALPARERPALYVAADDRASACCARSSRATTSPAISSQEARDERPRAPLEVRSLTKHFAVGNARCAARTCTRSTTSRSSCVPGRSPRSSARAGAARAPSRGCSRGCTSRATAASSSRGATSRACAAGATSSTTARRCR